MLNNKIKYKIHLTKVMHLGYALVLESLLWP